MDRASIHEVEQRLDAAMADFVKATEIAPKWSQPWAELGWLARRTGDFERSVDAASRSAELGNFDGYWVQALGLVALRRDDEAMDAVGQLMRKIPDAWYGYAQKAWIAYQTGKGAEAVELLNQSIEADPERSSTPYGLRAEMGLVSGVRGCDEAWADLNKAMEMDSESPSAAGNFALLSAFLGADCPDHYDGALSDELARRALEFDSKNDDWHRAYGQVLLRNGRPEEALRATEKALELRLRTSEDFPYIFQDLAMIHAQLGNMREARKYYDRAAAVIDTFAPRNLGWNHKQDQAAAQLGIER